MSVTGPASKPAPRRKRTPRRKPAAVADALSTLLQMATGQSSVQLELDSKQQVKPTVNAYHKSVHKAGTLAQAEFDRLMDAYYPKPAVVPVNTDAFSNEDLASLGLQRIPILGG